MSWCLSWHSRTLGGAEAASPHDPIVIRHDVNRLAFNPVDVDVDTVA